MGNPVVHFEITAKGVEGLRVLQQDFRLEDRRE